MKDHLLEPCLPNKAKKGEVVTLPHDVRRMTDAPQFAQVLKTNPYHAKDGSFTSKDKAVANQAAGEAPEVRYDPRTGLPYAKDQAAYKAWSDAKWAEGAEARKEARARDKIARAAKDAAKHATAAGVYDSIEEKIGYLGTKTTQGKTLFVSSKLTSTKAMALGNYLESKGFKKTANPKDSFSVDSTFENGSTTVHMKADRNPKISSDFRFHLMITEK